jgi:hypothetical protein
MEVTQIKIGFKKKLNTYIPSRPRSNFNRSQSWSQSYKTLFFVVNDASAKYSSVFVASMFFSDKLVICEKKPVPIYAKALGHILKL